METGAAGTLVSPTAFGGARSVNPKPGGSGSDVDPAELRAIVAVVRGVARGRLGRARRRRGDPVLLRQKLRQEGGRPFARRRVEHGRPDRRHRKRAGAGAAAHGTPARGECRGFRRSRRSSNALDSNALDQGSPRFDSKANSYGE